MLATIHSYWAYLVLLLLVFSVFNAILGFTSKRAFTDKDLRIGLFTLIVTHVQFLIGLVLYFYQGRLATIADSMKVSEARLIALEHPLTMIIAIVLITIGWSKHKKKVASTDKFKMFAIFYTLGLLLILSRIPWANWFN
ncbi:MAG: hypothetical protein HC798_00445 [Polaribacter sp.]|nr:hypothetical protein [Polaribacter sp.]